MDEVYRARIGKWLERYIEINDCRYGYGNDKVIKSSIKLLLSEVFTREELKKDALKYGNIILTDEMIDEILSEQN